MGDKEITNNEYDKNKKEESIASILGKTPKLIGKVKSQLDKIDDITINKDGTVTHNLLRAP